jgi:hypothetical protein
MVGCVGDRSARIRIVVGILAFIGASWVKTFCDPPISTTTAPSRKPKKAEYAQWCERGILAGQVTTATQGKPGIYRGLPPCRSNRKRCRGRFQGADFETVAGEAWKR